MFPQFNFNASFKSVSGLSFSFTPLTKREGGIPGFEHSLTNNGTYGTLTLARGFTADMGLYEWCEGTHNTLKTQPCNILVSALDKEGMPLKNWLVFHAIPNSWTAGNFDAGSSDILVESVSFSYQNFILI